MTPAEEQDLKDSQTAILQQKIQAFDFMTSISRMDAGMLKNSGFASKEAGLTYALKDAMQTIARIQKAHFTKYPD